MISIMGNSQTKNNHHDISSPKKSWDEENDRPIFEDKNAEYVFNFYGNYSRDEFLKANVNDPELEAILKDEVNSCLKPVYQTGCRALAHSIYHKGKKYGFAWINMAFYQPLCSINLLQMYPETHDAISKLKIERWLSDDNATIRIIHENNKIKWTVLSSDISARYVCDLLQNMDISIVQTDLNICEKIKIVTNKEELHSIVKKLIEYMLSINSIRVATKTI